MLRIQTCISPAPPPSRSTQGTFSHTHISHTLGPDTQTRTHSTLEEPTALVTREQHVCPLGDLGPSCVRLLKSPLEHSPAAAQGHWPGWGSLNQAGEAPAHDWGEGTMAGPQPLGCWPSAQQGSRQGRPARGQPDPKHPCPNTQSRRDRTPTGVRHDAQCPATQNNHLSVRPSSCCELGVGPGLEVLAVDLAWPTILPILPVSVSFLLDSW